MKKTKLLVPLVSLATASATFAPLATLTSCTNTPSIVLANTLTMKVGETKKIDATVASGATVTWKSSNQEVATVLDGSVTALNVGKTNITAEANGYTATCKIVVTDVEASATDKAYLDTINSYMTVKEGLMIPHKALTALKALGYDVTKYQLSTSELEICYDMSAKRFIIMRGDDVIYAPTDYKMASTVAVFKFTSSYDATSKYGQYLLDDYVWSPTDPATPFEVRTSIDVGNNTNIKVMHYSDGVANGQKSVIIRTFCELLNVEGGDTVYHFGEANNINVNYNGTYESRCNYIEVGKSAYLYAAYCNLSLVKHDSKDYAFIDVLESGVETKAVSVEEDYYGAYIAEDGCIMEGFTEEQTTPIQHIFNYDDLVTACAAGSGFIRLENDYKEIALPNLKDDLSNQIIVSGTDRTVWIDLNGCKLSETNTEEAASTQASKPRILVQQGASLGLMDCERTGSMNLYGHNIQIQGDSDSQDLVSTLYLNGIEINHGYCGWNSAPVKVGNGTASTTVAYSSKLYMYGGKITSKAVDWLEGDTNGYGIWAQKNSYTQIVYGTIEADTCCVGGQGSSDGTYIDINDGTFTVTGSNGLCFYLPQAGKLNISGGTFTGATIMGVRDGDIVISGGYFHATGTHTETPARPGAWVDANGSVITIDATGGGYGQNPSVTVTNAKMYSENSYIFHGIGTTSFAGLAEIDFFGGTFYFAQQTGIKTETEVADHFRVNQWGGSWVRAK